jgi:GDPmannose 4,6-dehydratase
VSSFLLFLISQSLIVHTISLLLGNPAKAEKILGWKRKVNFDDLVKEMVDADLKAAASLVEDQN